MLMCVYCSSGVKFVGCGVPQPTWPTTSMSGSFQWPGLENGTHLSWPNPFLLIESQLSRMSPVMRQQLAIFDSSGMFLNGVLFDRLRTTSRPLLRSALYISAVSGTSLGFQSYFR